MIKITKGEIEYFQSAKLNENFPIQHLFSTKKGSFNEIDLLSNYMDNNPCIVVPKQSHSSNIEIVTNKNMFDSFDDTDALITKHKNIFIAVKTADCCPILLFDPIEQVVAAVHSGWRGTIQNITGKTIQVMIDQFNSKPENILAAIGPCISQKNYEVGIDVIENFKSTFNDTSTVLQLSATNQFKAHLSIRDAIIMQLKEVGLNVMNIDISDMCTFERNENFFSARRDGSKTGRMLNGIFIKKHFT